MPHPRTHRLVVLGGDRVGKTAIIEQFIFGNHVIGQSGPPTVGDIYEVCIETEKGTTEKLQIYDSSGSLFTTSRNHYEQDHFLSIAHGILLVYEITSKASYDLIVSLRQKIALKNKELPIVVLGNKKDLNAIREVDLPKVRSWAGSHGIRPYEVSVMDRESLRDPFCYLAWRMANPSRPFSSLPLLVSTQGNLASAVPPSLSMDKPDGRSNHMASVGIPSEVRMSRLSQDSQNEVDFDPYYPPSGVPIPPCDAKFPGKHSAASLFLADCLSSKAKQQHYEQNRREEQ